MELSKPKRKLAFSDGSKWHRLMLEAANLEALRDAIGKAKERFQLTADVRVLNCYEAGRDEFCLHRYVLVMAIGNKVVDSSSIEVGHRKRLCGACLAC